MEAIILYSNYSQICKTFLEKLSKVVDPKTLRPLCIDNIEVRARLSRSTLNITKVPCVLQVAADTVNVYEGAMAWKLFDLNPETVVEMPVDLSAGLTPSPPEAPPVGQVVGVTPVDGVTPVVFDPPEAAQGWKLENPKAQANLPIKKSSGITEQMARMEQERNNYLKDFPR